MPLGRKGLRRHEWHPPTMSINLTVCCSCGCGPATVSSGGWGGGTGLEYLPTDLSFRVCLFFFFGQEVVVISVAIQLFGQRAGPIYKPVEIGERGLLSDKPLGEYTIYLHAHTQYFPVVHLAQVEAAGENCPYLMEPGPLSRAEAHGGLSAARGWVSASAASPSHLYQLSCSAVVTPRAFLADLVILGGHTSLLGEEAPW